MAPSSQCGHPVDAVTCPWADIPDCGDIAVLCPTVLYFTYGSNLCESRLLSRAPSGRFVGVARLAGHELRFHKQGRDGTGKADAWATGAPGHVWGALAEVSPADLERLDRFEQGYRRLRIGVDLDGGAQDAWVYVAEPGTVQPGLAPADWYLDHIVNGGRARGLPAGYVDTIARIAAVGSDGPAADGC